MRVGALATVLMDYPLKPHAVEREGIRHLSVEAIRAAPPRVMGQPCRLVCPAEKRADCTVVGSVPPRQGPLLQGQQSEQGDPGK